jgi:hypothetical protein
MPENPDKAIGVTGVLAEEFNKLHGGTFDPANPPTQDELFEAIHSLPKGEQRAALCLSGGGIRSASFALGILQGLAEAKILRHFHYLSTVSGGGYIGAWLSVWRQQVKNDKKLMKMLSRRRTCESTRLKTVEQQLGAPPEARYQDQDAYKEPVEIGRLRANSNFLTPKLGAMSADTWTLVALYIRNLLLNWAVYLPLILAALLVPLICKDVLLYVQGDKLVEFHHFVLAGAILLFTVAVFTSVRGRLAQDSKKRVDQESFLWLELLPIYAAAMLVCIYSVGDCNVTGKPSGCWATLGPGIAAIAGAVIYLTGWAAAFLRYGDRQTLSSPPTAGNPFPPVLLWLPWTAAGAIGGALVGLGLHLSKHLAADPTLIVVLGVGWVSISIFLANAVYLALTSLSVFGDVEREWLARSSGWFVAMTVVWAGFSALILYADFLFGYAAVQWAAVVSGGAGAVAAGIGSSARTLANTFDKKGESLPMTTVLSLAAVLFIVALAVVLAHVIPDLLRALQEIIGWGERPLRRTKLVAIVLCLAFALFVAYFVNVNRFSAHSLYRNRLIRAFLGSARGAEAQFSKTADPFTGFDRKDNVPVRDLIFPSDPAKRPRLFPVINMALNTVAGANNAWQERKAESFSVTPLRSGNEWVKYWPTGNYGSRDNGLSLGTAIAISGAAASPNMGYHSSPLVGLIMTLFNVRLGWWLGNPSRPSTAPQESPPFGMIQFVQELFGLTSDESPYVYLSDGGHFENLGLYEMVRRRCHFIVVSDAGCDPGCAFEDLGNAVRKSWIDLGVKITFQKLDIVKRGELAKDGKGVYCAVGTITYPETKEVGHVLYLKPCFLGTEPADVRAYAATSKDFPHESTADQFFSESQMESYRALGAHVVETVLGEAGDPDTDAPLAALGPYWKRIQEFASVSASD